MTVFTLLFIFLHWFSPLFSTTVAVQPPLAPALYVLGDFLLDSGNNNHLPTIARANYLPYGANFPWGNTGIFTNGKTVVHFAAVFSAISERSKLYTTYGIELCLWRLGEQVDLFEKTGKSELPSHFNNPERLLAYLSKSVIAISIGSNNYLNNYLETSFNTSQRFAPHLFAQLLVDSLSRQLQGLYNIGARKVIMFEIGSIGCIPSITGKYKHDGQCVEDKNQLVSYFNNRLPAMLANLTATLKGSNFVLGHVHRLGYDAAVNPSRYGIADATNPCCKAWFNGTSGCIPLLKPCPNVDKHYFWDGYHLIEVMYSLLAAHFIHDI